MRITILFFDEYVSSDDMSLIKYDNIYVIHLLFDMNVICINYYLSYKLDI